MTIAIAFLSFFIGLIGTFVAEQVVQIMPFLRNRFWVPHLLFGYHVHHSVYGLMIMIVGIFLVYRHRRAAIIAIGFGLGVIVMHTISDGRLIFVE